MHSIIRKHAVTLLLSILSLFSMTCQADCFDTAAKLQDLNPKILRAIALVESHNNPKAINRNRNGTIDIGELQINSVHLKELRKYGITQRDLLNRCTNIAVGAWLLRRKMDAHRNVSWLAIGGYHSETPYYRRSYATLVQHAMTTQYLASLGFQ